MKTNKSKISIHSEKITSISLHNKIISVKSGSRASNNKRIYIHLISKKPFTLYGLKFFLGNFIPKGYEFIFTGCTDKCQSLSGLLQCNECNLSAALKNLDLNSANEKNCPDILLIDDYGFFNNTSESDSSKNEDSTFLKSIIQLIFKNSTENDIKIILLTGNNNALYLKRYINLGVRGVVHITSAKENIIKAIEAVVNGGFYIDAYINTLISEYQKYLNNKLISNLTCRQLEVLLEISKSLKNHQMAPKLNISVSAVEKHKLNIQSILNLPPDTLNEYAVKNKNEIQFLLEFSKFESSNKRLWK